MMGNQITTYYNSSNNYSDEAILKNLYKTLIQNEGIKRDIHLEARGISATRCAKAWI